MVKTFFTQYNVYIYGPFARIGTLPDIWVTSFMDWLWNIRKSLRYKKKFLIGKIPL